MIPRMNQRLFILLSLCSLSFAGCLKTRSQLREDTGGAVPQHVETVAPQGGYAMDEMKQEITRLTGRLEAMERSQQDSRGSKNAEVEELRKLQTRIQELEQAQMTSIEAIKKLQENLPQADNVELYKKGRESLKAKKYDEAIKFFSQYLKAQNPEFQEEAIYLRGEAYFSEKNFKKAIVDYSKFPEKFSRSPLMPKALLKIAQSFEALGNKDDAFAFYDQLLEEYPKSPEAKHAKKRPGSKKKLK